MIRRHPWITAVIGTLLLTILCIALHFCRTQIQQQAMNDAQEALKEVMNHADIRLQQIEAATDSLIPQIETHLDKPEMMFDLSRKLLNNAPDIKGCSISFDAYFFKNKGQYFSAYSYNNGDSIATEQEGSDNYQYFYMDWYLIPRLLLHSYWTEPFAEQNDNGIKVNEIMTSYCQPINSAPDKTVGVLSADIPLSWLADLINNYHPVPHSYCMLIGRSGSYIVHPDTTRLLYESIFTPTLEHPDTALTSLGNAMTEGETGYKNMLIDGTESHVFYMPFRHTGWSIALVCPNEVILDKYRTIRNFLMPLILFSIVLMLMPVWRSLYRRKNYAAIWLALLATVSSCQQDKPRTTSVLPSDTPENASSIYNVIGEAGGGEPSLIVIDSLERVGSITTYEADFLRGEEYYDMQKFRSAVLFYKRAITGNKLLSINRENYYRAYLGQCVAYQNSNNIDFALDLATEGYQTASKDSTIEGRNATNNFLMHIGTCQIRLNHCNEAEKTFELARKGAETLALENLDNADCQESCLIIASNIINKYLNRKEYDRAKYWIYMMETALERYAATDASMKNYDTYLATLACDKAIIWAKTGHPEEAEVAYQNFLASDYATTFSGVYDQAYYLQTTEQWEKLLSISLRIDSAEIATGIAPTIDYLIESPSTIFLAMLKTGRKEAALHKAEQIIALLDSVKEYQHRSDAEELAVIYETQKKEEQIAEQRATLNHQRMIATVVVVLLLIVFLGILFEMYRRLRHAHALLETSYNNLVIANARAEESSKMKTNFIRQISHEIRTPLNILSGFTQVITMPDVALDSTTRTDINNKILENTNRITGLVNKMLELSDSTSQTVIERSDQVLAVQIAASAIIASNIEAAGHVTFTFNAGQNDGMYKLETNEKAATRALTLLLDNAQKFCRPADSKDDTSTKEQHVTLTLSQSGGFAYYTIEDTGIGVPIDEAEHIFDEFVQLNEFYEGTGIGLTVSRSLCRRLGGDVQLDTSYHPGSRFVMTLPLT